MTQTHRPTLECIAGGGEVTHQPSFLSASLERSLCSIEKGFMHEQAADGALRWKAYDVMYDRAGASWALYADRANEASFQVWRALPGESEFGWVPLIQDDMLQMPATRDHDGYQVRQMMAESGEQWNIVYASKGVFWQLIDHRGEPCELTMVRRRPTVVLGREAMAEVISLYSEPSIA
ncbi:MAG: hypothetical protein Q4A34_03145 [Candidatus Saccharibacteria bacterium]|nr:hypothetical protein [Candidatus Saccharibacteria bacterium]